MTNKVRYFARTQFANRVYKSNGMAFQQLFSAVQRAIHGQGFVEVQPQGAIGDQGCDGYIPAAGHYFQVYGPVDPEAKVTTAADKLANDFAKLKKHWVQGTPLRAYSFVFNDKYQGVFTRIAQALGALGAANPGIPCLPFTIAHLEDAFLGLTPDQMQGVLGLMLPDPGCVRAISYEGIRDAVVHIMNSPVAAVPTRWGEIPELNEKISLNNLHDSWAAVLRNASRRAGHVDTFLAKNSTFTKQALKDHLVAAYQPVRDTGRAILAVPNGMSREDLVFAEFRQSLLPTDATLSVQDAIDILIGYYFESCDVFDPYADKVVANASP